MTVLGAGTGHHVFVEDVGVPELSAEDRHHLRRVLRLRDGEACTVADGRGAWRCCRFGDPMVIDGSVHVEPRPDPQITIAFALVKGDRPELVVQKLTELGVDRIVPFMADRSVVRWDDDRAAKHVERLRKVAREASMQCRRAWLPEVTAVSTFAAIVSDPSFGGWVAAERGGDPPALTRPTVLIGPEGGWSEGERAQFAGTVGFGPQVLRAETAALGAAAVLGALRAGLVRPELVRAEPDRPEPDRPEPGRPEPDRPEPGRP